MQLEAMLEKCKREQWKVGDLDWSQTPRAMTRDDEISIVQYFTDMAGIERLAGALFAEQENKTDNPVLRKIFRTFVVDEVRHAQAAQMLADFYDVHRYQVYQVTPALTRFTPHFVNLIQYLSPEVANAYVTSGELILDIALLRSLNDYVGDAMSQQAMDLINRDESRHIAIDFHMVGYYSSEEYVRELKKKPKTSLRHRMKASWAMANVFYYSAPFFKAVFFEPMRRVDPSGKRMREAFKRIQLIGAKPTVGQNPVLRSMLATQEMYNDRPVFRAMFGPFLERVIGLNREHIMRLYSEDERRRAENMSFGDMAEEALGAKYS